MSNDDVRKEMDALKADLSALRADIGGLVSSLKEAGTGKASEVRDKARIELDRRLQQLHEAYDEVVKHGGDCCENVSHRIEERPMASIAIAFAAGLLFARVMTHNGK